MHKKFMFADTDFLLFKNVNDEYYVYDSYEEAIDNVSLVLKETELGPESITLLEVIERDFEVCSECGSVIKTFMHTCSKSNIVMEVKGCPKCDDACGMCKE